VVVNQLREACARVSDRARYITINHEQIPLYAASLPTPRSLTAPAPLPAELVHGLPPREYAAWYWLTLDAINFGSGWFPTLNKARGRSGYATVSGGLRDHFDSHGPWDASELQQLTAAEIAQILRQDGEHELMTLFATSLNDLGTHLEHDHYGSPLRLIVDARRSATALVEILAGWDCFADTSDYHGLRVPFLKRAQITPADLSRAGVAEFHDLDQLTMFADNLVPHVLRLDGILDFDPELVARIEAEQLIAHGSDEEIEIRACAVQAVEEIVAASPEPVSAAQIDELLWHQGQGPRYKSTPRHRSRSTAY
jgi:hypothetical protein